MKPNFALILSFEGIGLLQRAFPGWKTVGDVSLETNDLRAALGDLRNLAVALDPDKLASKLVLPNDQIKYMSFTTDTRDTAAIDTAVKSALEGETPYAVDELAIDWSLTGDQVLVAAVARDTLAEAEDFAAEYEFSPVSFVATPEAGQFAGEPFFGETRFFKRVYGEDAFIEKDGAPVRVVGTATLPQKPTVVAPPAPAFAAPDAAAATPEQAGVLEGDVPDQESTAEPLQDESAASEDTLEQTNEDDSATDAEEEQTPLALDASNPGAPENTPENQYVASAEESVTFDHGQADPAPVSQLTATEDTGTPATFASIRAQRRALSPTPAPRLNGAARDADTPSAPTIPIDHDETIASGFSPAVGPPERLQPAAKPGKSAAKTKTGSFLTRRRKSDATQVAKPAKRQVHTPIHSQQDVASEAERMTVFGARKGPAVGGKPKYLGLVLALVLLLFLAAVAAWAAIFMDDGVAGLFGPRTQDSITAQLPEHADDELAMEGEEAMLPDPDALQDDIGMSNSTDNAVFEALNDAEPEMDPDEAQARYAVSGVWQLAPAAPQSPSQTTLDDLYVASIDSDIGQSDAVALPTFSEADTDREPLRNSSPAAAGTKFALDDRGLVIATAAGAVTPDGVRVFAGRPGVVPTAYPARTTEATEVAVTQTQTDTELAGFRPKLRPENLIEQNERSSLGGLSRQELAAFRPKLRPAVPEVKVAEAVTEETTEETVERTPETGTAQAVASSRKPNARPSNFSKIVDRASKTAQPEAEQEATTVAAAAPRTIQPSIPSKASVAKQATVRNAINLRKVNLIGVYGKPNSRRALVRLSNGRYKKVQVGDRIDGGKVAAIGEAELRYTKNGRNVILTMPKG